MLFINCLIYFLIRNIIQWNNSKVEMRGPYYVNNKNIKHENYNGYGLRVYRK